MPLFWTIDSRAQLFTAVAEGHVTLADALELLETMAGAKALSYRKLLDGRRAVSAMPPDEILQLCVKIRSYHDHRDLGAVAIVGTPEQTVIFSRLLGALAAGNRPFKIFTTPRQAHRWLSLLRRPPPLY
jgi:hypothetical protein